MPKFRKLVSQLRQRFALAQQSLPNRGRPNDSWYWEVLETYRDKHGRNLRQAELAWMVSANIFDSDAMRHEFLTTNRWMSSPRPSNGPLGVAVLLDLIGAFYGLNEPFTYLEFGVCFGTTFTQVLSTFKNARGIGIELVPERFEVAQWLIQRAANASLAGRAEVQRGSVLQARIPPNSVDVVFMDTSHVYPDEYEMVSHLFAQGKLRTRFLFIGDDPLHTGTDLTRRRLIAEWGDRYKFITRADLNLYWFFPC